MSEEARAAWRAIRDYLKLVSRTSNALLKDRHFREALSSLFHAARIVVMAYLSKYIAKIRFIRRMLFIQ